jgi:hypothetical protein
MDTFLCNQGNCTQKYKIVYIVVLLYTHINSINVIRSHFQDFSSVGNEIS